MKKPVTSLVLLATFLAVAQTPPPPVTVATVLDAPEKYDTKVITAVGTVTKFKAKVSRIGNPYISFSLTTNETDPKQRREMQVYGKGKLLKDKKPWALKDGDQAFVTGKFEKEHKSGNFTYKNELVIDLSKDCIKIAAPAKVK